MKHITNKGRFQLVNFGPISGISGIYLIERSGYSVFISDWVYGRGCDYNKRKKEKKEHYDVPLTFRSPTLEEEIYLYCISSVYPLSDFSTHVRTETGLRIPRDTNPGKHIIIEGVPYYPRILLQGDEEIGEVILPYRDKENYVYCNTGNPLLFSLSGETRMDFDFDPTITDDIALEIKGHRCDEIVNTEGYNHRCRGDISIIARYPRSSDDGGVRPILGKYPEYSKKIQENLVLQQLHQKEED